MHEINIQNIDLNLLVAFDALYQECNVTRAGARIGLSQPAMSHALTRLRQLCDDPLFVRTRTGVEPTPFARQIANPIREGLAMLQTGLSNASTFDPATSDRTFHLLLSDIGEVAYLPPLLTRLREVAPRVDIRALALPREHYRAAFESGDADLAIGFLPRLQAGFYQQRLLDDSYVGLARADHPRVHDTLSLEQFLEESHVMVEPAGSRYSSATGQSSTMTLLERHLADRGLQRRIALRVPHFVVVPTIVRATDMLAIVPTYVLASVKPLHNLKVLPLPFDVPRFDIKQFWHQRDHHDAANRWLRGLIADLFLRPTPPVHGGRKSTVRQSNSTTSKAGRRKRV